MEGLGLEDSNEIQYSEFLAATMDMNHAIREENILRAFQHFDTDGSGEIITTTLILIYLYRKYHNSGAYLHHGK